MNEPYNNNDDELPAYQTLLNMAVKKAGRALTEDEVDLVQGIYEYIWSGMYDHAVILEFIDDQLDSEADLELLKSLLPEEMANKVEAEKTWPKYTDCDRLDEVFIQLNGRGIIALHNAGYTMSDGHDDVDEAIDERGKAGLRGFCFYHGQDLECAVYGGGLTLAFGDLDGDETAMVMIGKEIQELFEQADFEVEWEGTADRRITIMNIDWKRRGFGQY